MDNIVEVVTLLRRQSELELQLLNNDGRAVVTEHELEATQRRLAAHPYALNAVLQTARVLRRDVHTVTARNVENWGCLS